MMALMGSVSLLVALLLSIITTQSYTPPVPPKVSPATNLPNQLYTWRETQQIRYQACGPSDGAPVVLVHGLFVNSDHWRHTLKFLGEQGYRAYALDLWGCGYSSKPTADSAEAQAVNGETGRFAAEQDKVLRGAILGTAGGVRTRVRDVELAHPLQSPYNFYTWSNLLTDFCQDVVLDTKDVWQDAPQISLVANSIGCISALQAVLDAPELFKGVFAIAPNFRELHSAEVPASKFVMPIIRRQQQILREKGQGLFDYLAKPATVKQILKEPYFVKSAVDDMLVSVLLDPLLTEGASKVVFDSLSYSAGPLPELQLEEIARPVWVCYGKADPWTPTRRVEALLRKDSVERVVGWDGVGHCPFDEAPELVNPCLFEFLERLRKDGHKPATKTIEEVIK